MLFWGDFFFLHSSYPTADVLCHFTFSLSMDKQENVIPSKLCMGCSALATAARNRSHVLLGFAEQLWIVCVKLTPQSETLCSCYCCYLEKIITVCYAFYYRWHLLSQSSCLSIFFFLQANLANVSRLSIFNAKSLWDTSLEGVIILPLSLVPHWEIMRAVKENCQKQVVLTNLMYLVY